MIHVFAIIVGLNVSSSSCRINFVPYSIDFDLVSEFFILLRAIFNIDGGEVVLGGNKVDVVYIFVSLDFLGCDVSRSFVRVVASAIPGNVLYIIPVVISLLTNSGLVLVSFLVSTNSLVLL